MKILLAATAALFGLVVGAPAQAGMVPVDEGGDTSPCVTYGEYAAATNAYMHHRVSRGQVRRIFDTDGHRGGAAVIDGMVAQVPVAAGHEVARPQHRMVRYYLGCVAGRDATVYVEFNTRTSNVTFLASP